MKYKKLAKRLEKSAYLQPVVKIKLLSTGDIGIVVKLGQPFCGYMAGDIIIFWNDGEVTTLTLDDEIEIMHSDLFDERVKE